MRLSKLPGATSGAIETNRGPHEEFDLALSQRRYEKAPARPVALVVLGFGRVINLTWLNLPCAAQ
jgi:hypothetical protein